MQCSEAEELLVPFHDGELPPSGLHLMCDHLARCPSCRALSEELRATTPRPFLDPPLAVQRRLEAATDTDLILAGAARRRRAPRSRQWSRWLARQAPVSRGMVLGYGLLLAATFGWGLANWYSLAASTAPGGVAAPASASEIPADQYRPASYSPNEADFPGR